MSCKIIITLACFFSFCSAPIAKAEQVLFTREFPDRSGAIFAPEYVDSLPLSLYFDFLPPADGPDEPPSPAVEPPLLQAHLTVDNPAILLSSDSGELFDIARNHLLQPGPKRFLLTFGNGGTGGLLAAFDAKEISRIELEVQANPYKLTENGATSEVCLACPSGSYALDPTLHASLVIYGTVPEPDNISSVFWVTIIGFGYRRRFRPTPAV